MVGPQNQREAALRAELARSSRVFRTGPFRRPEGAPTSEFPERNRAAEGKTAAKANELAVWTRLRMRIPTKPATHSNRKPATDSDLKPAGVPI
jgi:hypothetical protein